MRIDWIGAPMFEVDRSGLARIALRIAALVLLAFVLAACGKSSELEWTEEVRLPDGRALALNRWVEFKGPRGLGGSPTESSQRLEFKNPDTGEVVKWQSSSQQGFLKTVALWLDQGRPQLLSTPAYGGDSRRRNCPNPPYLLFEYVRGEWNPKLLALVPIKKIRANLTTHPLERRAEIEQNSGHLSIADTSDSHAYLEGVHPVPYIIQFEGMPEQTFKREDCSRVSNLNELISVGVK